MKKKILLIAGGYSNEREISLLTAKSVFLELKNDNRSEFFGLWRYIYLIGYEEVNGKNILDVNNLSHTNRFISNKNIAHLQPAAIFPSVESP